VALSDSSGDTVQSYQYSVYGQVAASDPNFTANPYLFTGRRFDYETGLYYYRARYYNPYIGRFLQTDPVGYSAGMNLYAYCSNDPLGLTDPFGCDPCDPCDPCNVVFESSGGVGAVAVAISSATATSLPPHPSSANTYPETRYERFKYLMYEGFWKGLKDGAKLP
jgi:RHS repeat-associated protein